MLLINHSAIIDLCINSRFLLSRFEDLPAVQSKKQKQKMPQAQFENKP